MLLYQSIFYNFFKTIGYLLIAIAMSILVGTIYSALLLMTNGAFLGISFWDQAFMAGYFLSPPFIVGTLSYLAFHSFMNRGKGKSLMLAIILSVLTVGILFCLEK
ncbi:phosphoglycerol transferase MdoB-like AlkP superfamily enzyme [Alkalihalobacillus xiaoxiensis]|uniref:Phosphoglycerol transferase MdoB-like AlkP superfamily enzyme n=1 Tax=Shouchella xiaoxiensis TaxID=766895 RepID=A0ABS2SR14_9BACI|nr:hypothetical protein [Shouchella xiaoxiensis]MBM7836964.1 phosphoglycerol transferase MdoB-like AlkP superfamily enzyme [Shouchella xiaoxiensis]